jgi:hypothetical protein
MKLWKLSQKVNNNYDTFDSAVVAAETKEDARLIHPGEKEWNGTMDRYWCDAERVIVEYLGETDRVIPNKTVIVASFNAG